MALGFPFWRSLSERIRQEATIELSGGVSTDKDFLQVHTTVFFGVGYQLGYITGPLSADSDQPGLLGLRAGIASLDNPSTITTPTNIMVNVNGGLPQFDHQWVPALGVVLAHPLFHGIYLTASVNVYSLRNTYGGHNSGPDQWNVNIGVSIPFDTLSRMVSVPFQHDQNNQNQ